jgi:glycosyltransferase involved in cell wall biosynthesis
MKIALCSSVVPFVYGGGRNIVEWLEAMLREAGHHVERVYLPHMSSSDLLFSQIAAFRWVDLSSADRIVCLRPPAHFIPHPHKVLWFIHHTREFYDLWDSPYRLFPDDARHRGMRDALHTADTAALGEAVRIFTNSRVVGERLRRFNGMESEVLYPPLFRPERFHRRTLTDEIACVCRLEHHKRQHLLVDALRFTRTGVRLRLYGASSNHDYADDLRRRIREARLDDRVTFEDRWISEEEKVEAFADCLAAAYVPLDEDSYGYSSLEAAYSSKAVLTTTDSGGVLELVQDGVNGIVVEPHPQALGEAMDRLYLDRDGTRRMGERARARLDDLDISWEHVLERLMS